MRKHWSYTEIVSENEFDKFKLDGFSISTSNTELSPHEGVLIRDNLGRQLEGVHENGRIRGMKDTSSPNRDLRLYRDSLLNKDITIMLVNGLMGSGKTYTCLREVIRQNLRDVVVKTSDDGNIVPQYVKHQILISKPYFTSGGEDYGYLPGTLDDKINPSIQNYIQYFNRFHKDGFEKLKKAGYISILPLGYVRGIDAQDTTIIVDEAQNAQELISIVTRLSKGSRVFILGDTSPFQIDNPRCTPTKNGMTSLRELLDGAPYFQHIELTSINNIVRSKEVKDIVTRLFKKHGEISDWR